MFPHAAARFHVFLLPPHRREAATIAAITSLPSNGTPNITAAATAGDAPTSSPQLSQASSSSTRKGDIIPGIHHPFICLLACVLQSMITYGFMATTHYR